MKNSEKNKFNADFLKNAIWFEILIGYIYIYISGIPAFFFLGWKDRQLTIYTCFTLLLKGFVKQMPLYFFLTSNYTQTLQVKYSEKESNRVMCYVLSV